MLACAGALGLAVAAADFAGRQFKTMLELAETCVAQKQHIESVAASFDAALANMPHGVALYDSEQRVLLANRRYAEMYGLQPGDIKPGMTMKEILELRAAKGVYLGDDATRYVDGRALTPPVIKPIEFGESKGLPDREPVLIVGFDGVAPAFVVSKRPFAGNWEYMLDEAIFTAPATVNWQGAALINRQGKLVGVGSLLVGDAMG